MDGLAALPDATEHVGDPFQLPPEAPQTSFGPLAALPDGFAAQLALDIALRRLLKPTWPLLGPNLADLGATGCPKT